MKVADPKGREFNVICDAILRIDNLDDINETEIHIRTYQSVATGQVNARTIKDFNKRMKVIAEVSV